jgi:cobaltochelatase CobS
MTTQTISIPTIARGKVRAFVKSLSGFEAFANSLGVPSREVKNADLLVFADRKGRMADVLAIIASATQSSTVITDAEIERIVTVPTEVSGYSLDAVLGTVDQFLSPVVKRELETALRPIIDAANKPAVVQEKVVEKIVTVGAPVVAPVGQVPYAVKTGATIEFNKLFGTKSTQPFGKRPISLWEAHGLAPAIDPYFVVTADSMAALATAAEHGTNVWLVGPTGSGKSTMPMQFAAYTGRPYVKIAFTKQTEVDALVGNTGVKDGATYWEDGALIAAIRRPGTVIVLEEPTTAPAGVQMIVQNMTDDHRSYTIHSTGEVVKVAPGVVFVIGDNTNGTGDETGQYAGTNQANASLVNRFKRMVQVDYLSKSQEIAAIINHTGIPAPAAEHIVDFMQRARKLPEMEGIGLSIRLMVGFVDMVKDGFGAKYAFECAVLTRLPGTERAAIETMATLQWSQDFENLLAGVNLTNAPSSSEAATAFDDEVSASFSS